MAKPRFQKNPLAVAIATAALLSSLNVLANIDSDADGLPDNDELVIGTNPQLADSDNDGMGDGFEVEYGLNPLQNDAQLDNDNDGLSNILESDFGLDPTNPDTDSDNLTDGQEYWIIGSSPASWDSNMNGIKDGFELSVFGSPFSQPVGTDSDNDGINDDIEYLFFSNPLDQDSLPPGKGIWTVLTPQPFAIYNSGESVPFNGFKAPALHGAMVKQTNVSVSTASTAYSQMAHTSSLQKPTYL